MIVLFESPKGYSILNHTPSETAVLNSYIFSTQDESVESFTQIVRGKLPANLTTFLKSCDLSKSELLIVGEKKLGKKISEVIEVKCKVDIEIFRKLKEDASKLSKILGFENNDDYRSQTLFIAHKLCTDKLAVNPELIDNMAIQAVNMLEDLDNDINMHSMRIKEWYGCHFPELSEIFTDNLKYLKVVNCMKNKENLRNEETIKKLREECNIDEETLSKIISMSQVSVGMALNETDLSKILESVTSLIKSFSYREDLNNYLSKRMTEIAPNLTALVGDMIGAKMIAKIGSLSALSKAPASTIQILGAEKAFFLAIKGKTNTPKYGIIYHAPLLGKVSQEKKGKVARILANKIAIAVRIDYFRSRSDENIVFDNSFGLKTKIELENKLESIENKSKGKRKKDSGNKRKFEFNNTNKYDEKNDANKNKRMKTE